MGNAVNCAKDNQNNYFGDDDRDEMIGRDEKKTKLKSEGSKQTLTRSELHSALSTPNEMNSHIKVMERAVNDDTEIVKVEGFPYLHPETFDF